MKNNYEMVNHPKHYNVEGRKECIDEMLDIWGTEAVILWCKMTAYKYQYRLGNKPDNSIEQEKKKIDWYLEKAKNLMMERDSKKTQVIYERSKI